MQKSITGNKKEQPSQRKHHSLLSSQSTCLWCIVYLSINCNSEKTVVLTNCCVLTHSVPCSQPGPRGMLGCMGKLNVTLGNNTKNLHEPCWGLNALQNFRACMDVIKDIHIYVRAAGGFVGYMLLWND